ncbi:IS110 family transposase [Pedobacter frigiditerrae]|uniref:IS110 family transposase n=1 Tax=Pedobacter frigiditerrae TaxID=2530452 RepID=A0A4R0N1L6_9SPHI|nr:transposase [Pedobacter frigiditerrae]TCC93708.1 IS110 family transposase [Pedobacter frigiditerrae]
MEATSRKKNYTYFIGTDVSRNKLDHVVMKGTTVLFHREIKNNAEEITAFIQELKALTGFTVSKAVFAMEHTGIYCNHLLNCLKRVKANIVLEGALHIRNSLGNIRGKNDKIDARRIAEYAYKSRDHLRLWMPKRQVLVELANLSTIRTRLLSLQVAINVPLKEQSTFIKKGVAKSSVKLCSRSIEALKADIEEVNISIAKLIREDERLNQLMKIVTSVPCIGPITAVHLLVCTNEFRDINNPKKFACYAGVAPFLKSSGTVLGKARVSHMANKKMKSLLHICAMGSVKNVPEMKAYYLRKTEGEGKQKMLVLNAIRNKLILRIFACVNQDRSYQAVYLRSPTNEINSSSER